MATAVYSTATLKEQNAQPYRSMAGKLQAPLLKALDNMGYEYVETSCTRISGDLYLEGWCSFNAGTCIYATDIANKERACEVLVHETWLRDSAYETHVYVAPLTVIYWLDRS